MICGFDDLLVATAALSPRRVVVAGAAKAAVLLAAREAVDRGRVCLVLVADEPELRRVANALEWDLGAARVVHQPGDEGQLASCAVREVVEGRGDLLMKGGVSTAALLHAVLRAPELRTGRRLSHVAAVEAPGYGRLQLHTDGGINILQDLPVAQDILHNAVGLARALGQARPSIAGLALVETVTESLPETQRMADLAHWVKSKGLGEAEMEGPVGLDIAASAACAALKGVQSKIAGNADIFFGPNITAVNFVVKALATMAGAQVAGMVLGAKVPLVVLSRSDSPQTRLLSLALATLYDERGHES